MKFVSNIWKSKAESYNQNLSPCYEERRIENPSSHELSYKCEWHTQAIQTKILHSTTHFKGSLIPLGHQYYCLNNNIAFVISWESHTNGSDSLHYLLSFDMYFPLFIKVNIWHHICCFSKLIVVNHYIVYT